MKEIVLGNECRNQLKIGIDKLSNAVKLTLGPRGRNVLLSSRDYGQHLTKDGVSIAKSIFLKNPIENSGAQIIKEVSNRTNSIVGDGTTTSIVLTQSLIEEGLKYIDSGVNPYDLKKGMDISLDIVKNYLFSISRLI